MTRFGQEVVKFEKSDKLPIKFLDWKPKLGIFNRYNSDTKENEQVNLGEFTILNVGFRLSGWSDQYHCFINSQEMENFRGPYVLKESANGTVLFTGEYDREITKATINDLGASLTLTITVISGEDICKLSFTGISYKEANEFLSSFGNDKNTHTAKFDGIKVGGKFKYPKFIKGAELTEKQITIATLADDALYPSGE